jgi:peptidoglycan/LPS O-acetylase OafA/YrhL
MSLILTKKYNTTGLFYSNRFLRLYPAYALILLATISWFLFDWAYTGHRPPPFWTAQADAETSIWQWLALQFSNVTMVGLDVPALFHWKSGQGFLFLHALPDTAPDGAEWVGRFAWVGQAWSIGAEIWFYILAPYFVRAHIAILTAFTAASVCVGAWMTHNGLEPYYFFPANLWLFLSGVALFRFYQSRYYAWPK